MIICLNCKCENPETNFYCNKCFQLLKPKSSSESEYMAKMKPKISSQTKSMINNLLKANDPSSWQKATTAIIKSNDENAVLMLINGLEDSRKRVVSRSAEMLGIIGNTKALDALEKTFSNMKQRRVSPDAIEFKQVTHAISKLRRIKKDQEEREINDKMKQIIGLAQKGAYQELITILIDFDDIFSNKAQEELIKIGEPAVQLLINCLNTSNMDDLRKVIFTLAGIGSPVAIEPIIDDLCKILIDSDDELSKKAQNELIKIGEPAVKPLISKMNSLRSNKYKVVFTLTEINSPNAVEPLTKALIILLKDPNGKHKEKAREELIKIGEPAVEPLIKTLNEKTSFGCDEAEEALLQIGNKKGLVKIEKIRKKRQIDDLIKNLDGNKEINLNSLDKLVLDEYVESLQDEGNVDGLIEILNCNDNHLRGLAITALGNIGDTKAIRPFINILKDDDPILSSTVAECFGYIGYSSVKPLLKTLRDKNCRVGMYAAIALGKINDKRLIEPLRKKLHQDNKNFRFNVAIALGHMGDKTAIEPLLEALNHPNKYLRSKAAHSIGYINDKRSLEALLRALNDSENTVIWMAMKSLGRIGDEKALKPLLNNLNHSNQFMRRHAAIALGYMGDKRAINPLIKTLNESDGRFTRPEAAIALGKIGDETAAKPLLKAFNGRDYFLRGAATEALGKICDSKIVNQLIERLTDPEYYVRWNAAEALGNIGDKKAVVPLMERLIDPERIVRWKVAEALGKIGDEKAVESLIIALDDIKFRGRCAAAEALGKIGDRKAIPSLIEILSNSNTISRSNAAEALGRIRDKRAVEPLIDALYYTDDNVRINVIVALGKIGDKDAIMPLSKVLDDPNPFIRELAGNAIKQLDNEEYLAITGKNNNNEINDLINNLDKTDKEAYQRALKNLVDIGQLAVPYLIIALESTDDELREGAVTALGKIGGESVFEPLIKSLNDPDEGVRKKAVTALGHMGDKRAINPLTEAIKDPDYDVRYNARDALVNLDAPLGLYLKKTNYPISKKPQTLTIEYIREMGENNDISGLILGANDKDEGIRFISMQRLWDWGTDKLFQGDEKPIDVFLNLLNHTDPKIRKNALVFFNSDEIIANGLTEMMLQKLEEHDLKELSNYLRNGALDAKDENIKKMMGLSNEIYNEEEVLQKQLIYDTDKSMRIIAARKLGEMNSTNSFFPLIRSLNDESSGVRKATAEALGKINERPSDNQLIFSYVLNDLFNAMKDPDKVVRENVVLLLSKFHDPRAFGVIVDAMKDADETVSHIATDLLHKMNLMAIVNEIKEMVNKNNFKGIIKLLDDPDDKRRYLAASSLNKIFYTTKTFIDSYITSYDEIKEKCESIIENCSYYNEITDFYEYDYKLTYKELNELGHALWRLTGSDRENIAYHLDDYYNEENSRSGIQKKDFTDNARKIEKMEITEEIKGLLKLAVQWQDKSMSSIGGMAYYSALRICQPDISPLLIIIKDLDGKELVLAKFILNHLHVDTEPFEQFEKIDLGYLTHYFLTNGFRQEDWKEVIYFDDPKDKLVKDIAKEIISEAKKGDSYHGFYTPQSERIRSLTSKLIRENDDYMDDIIAGLYGKK